MMGNFFLGTGLVCGVLFGWFRLLDFYRSKEKEDTQFWYYTIWKRLDNSKFKSLPEQVIKWFFNFFNKPFSPFSAITKTLLPNVYVKYGINIRQVTSLVRILLFVIIFGIILVTIISLKIKSKALFFYSNFGYLLLFILLGILMASAEEGIKRYRKDKLNGLNLPQYPVIDSLEKDIEKIKYEVWLFIIAVFSFLLNYIAIYLGWKESINKDWFDFNVTAVIFINVIFDFLTVFATFYILKEIAKTKYLLSQFLLIVLDIIISAALALLSIFVINFLFQIGISYQKILFTLVGRSENGSLWEINEWFWLIHTTFIPTLIYLSVLLTAIIGKTIILPFNKFIGKASVVDNPHKLTAYLFGFFGILFSAFASFLKWG